MDRDIVVVFLAIMGVIFFFNIIKVFMNVFSSSSSAVVEVPNPLRDEIREEVEEKVKPNLHALEALYGNGGASEGGSGFGAFVFDKFKDKFSNFVEKDEKLVETEICNCCSDYEDATCKEEFCLEGAGISCQKG